MRSLLFGLNLDTSVVPGRDPAADARRAEELGFDFLTSADHPSGASPTYETWTLLSFAAAATSRDSWSSDWAETSTPAATSGVRSSSTP